MQPISQKRDQLVDLLRGYDGIAVALSGGVDSAVVAKASQLALGDRAVAVTAVSPSLSKRERRHAEQTAGIIGIRHVELETNEFARPEYARNSSDRCYFCKTELYSTLTAQMEALNVSTIANGANSDDLGDWRPGMKAAAEHSVISPLIDLGIDKAQVRELARSWELPVWDKPASPCLSSRIAYGVEVTPDRVEAVERAEAHLRELGFRELRVRIPQPKCARIEIPPSEFPLLLQTEVRVAVVEVFKEVGFINVSLDLEGFRSGSLNSALQLDVLQ